MRFLLFALLFSTCFATEDEFPRSSPEQIAASRRDFLIGDAISPFSGQIVLQERDLVVKGAEPLFVDRYYNFYCLYFSVREGELPTTNNLKQFSGWRIYPQLKREYLCKA